MEKTFIRVTNIKTGKVVDQHDVSGWSVNRLENVGWYKALLQSREHEFELVKPRFQLGQKVTYFLGGGPREHGIIKSNPGGCSAFVVYNCNNDWANYHHYTAQSTPLINLLPGWG